MWLSDLIRKIKYGKAPPGLPAIVSAVAKEGENWITINGKKIELPSVVRHGLIFHTIFVVVLDIHYNNMRNVLAFDGDGNQIWMIENPGFAVEGAGYALVDSTDGILMALCRGVGFFIDPKDGSICETHDEKGGSWRRPLFFQHRSKLANIKPVTTASAHKGDRSVVINGKTIQMPAKVTDGLIFQEIFVVVLEANYNNMRNVLAFDGDGNRLWTIEKPQSVMKLLGLSQRWSGYISVGGIGSELVAQSEGAQFFINSKTGKIYDRRFDE